MIKQLIFAAVAATVALSVEAGKPISLSTGHTTDEMARSSHPPEEYFCDLCHATAYQVHTALKTAEGKRTRTNIKNDKPLLESDVEDIFDETCNVKENKSLESYGPRPLDDSGATVLGGPGLYEDKPLNGAQMSGGLWPGRIVTICGKMRENLGTDKMYKAFRADGPDSTHLQYRKQLCETMTKCSVAIEDKNAKPKKKRKKRRRGGKTEL